MNKFSVTLHTGKRNAARKTVFAEDDFLGVFLACCELERSGQINLGPRPFIRYNAKKKTFYVNGVPVTAVQNRRLKNMHASSQFVVYRVTKYEPHGDGKQAIVAEREFVCSMADADKPVIEYPPITKSLKKAITFEQSRAFTEARALGDKWTVGRLIADRNGVRVEE